MNHDMDYSCIRDNDCGGTCFGCTLGICRKCHQYEGGLATDCPGVYITNEQANAIYNGELDFKDGKWIVLTKQ